MSILLALLLLAQDPPASRVPPVLRQGTWTHPQAVSAVDVGDEIAVTTLAFRHDRNFWRLSPDGKILGGRSVAPWAPFQVVSAGPAHAVGLAYSRVTGPQPTMSLFASDDAPETAIVDSLGELGWLRYGSGDWKTGWIPSLIGDLVAKSGDSIVTVRGHDGALRMGPDGVPAKLPFPNVRPYRLSPSADGGALAFGFIVPDRVPEEPSLPWPRRLLSVVDPTTGKDRWSFAAPPAAAAPALPDPVRDFPEFAESFGLKVDEPVPFRVATSLSISADGAHVALADYAGRMALRRGPVSGRWHPPYRAVPFVPRQRGTLRIVSAPGTQAATVPFPADGLFELRADAAFKTVWAFPASWFARGMAGVPWLPTDGGRTVHVFNVAAGAWSKSWDFPDAVADFALSPDGQSAWVSCWDGALYRIGRDTKRLLADAPARLAWSADGAFAIAGTALGEVIRLDPDGREVWRTKLPGKAPPLFEGRLKPAVEGIPVYPVGRTGQEHAYVGDIWLVKAPSGPFLVDAGGSSALPATIQKVIAADADPEKLKRLLQTHSHGDHAGGAYLWRAFGLKITAPETASLATTWLMPTVTDYGVWVPRPVDERLPLKRVGDECDFEVEGAKVKAVFLPGHSYDLVTYLFELGGKRVAFTGDLGFKGQDILHRCWGDADKAEKVTEAVASKVLAFKPDAVFTGHDSHADGSAFLEDLVARSRESIRKARSK